MSGFGVFLLQRDLPSLKLTFSLWKFQLVGKDAHLNLFGGQTWRLSQNRCSFSWSVIRKGNAMKFVYGYGGHLSSTWFVRVTQPFHEGLVHPKKPCRHVQVWVIPSFPSTKKIPGSGLLGFDFDTLETFFQSQGSGTVRKRNSFREKWAGMIFSSEAYSNLGCAYLVKKCKWAIDDLCCPLLKWRANEHGEAWTPTRKKSKGVLQIERLGTLCRDIFLVSEPDIFWDDLFSCVNLLKRQFQCILSMFRLENGGQFLVPMLGNHGQEKSCVCLTIGRPRTPGHSERMNPFSELFLRK